MKPKHDCGVVFNSFNELLCEIKNNRQWGQFDIINLKHLTDLDRNWKDYVSGRGYFIGIWAEPEAKLSYPDKKFINNLALHSELIKALV